MGWNVACLSLKNQTIVNHLWRGIEHRWIGHWSITEKQIVWTKKTLFLPIKPLSYLGLLLIRWGASQVELFFFNEPIWLAHHSKKLKLWRLPKIERFYFEVYTSSSLAHLYGWKEDKFVKAYGIKVRSYEEHVGEHIGNLVNILGTWWEPHWKLGKNEKKILPLTQTLRKKNQSTLSACLGLPIGCMKFLFP
jgi:hypothetical protein